MNIKKEYEKFFERKKNDLCVHDAEDVITFAKHYQALQLQQTGVMPNPFLSANENAIIQDEFKAYSAGADYLVGF